MSCTYALICSVEVTNSCLAAGFSQRFHGSAIAKTCRIYPKYSEMVLLQPSADIWWYLQLKQERVWDSTGCSMAHNRTSMNTIEHLLTALAGLKMFESAYCARKSIWHVLTCLDTCSHVISCKTILVAIDVAILVDIGWHLFKFVQIWSHICKRNLNFFEYIRYNLITFATYWDVTGFHKDA